MQRKRGAQLARLNRQTKRRIDVVGILPNLTAARPLTDTETIVLQKVAAIWPASQCTPEVSVAGGHHTRVSHMAAGHAFTAWIERRDSDQSAAATFAAFVGAGRDVRESHYFVSSACLFRTLKN